MDAELRAERDAQQTAEGRALSQSDSTKFVNPFNKDDGSDGDETPKWSTRFRAEIAAIVQAGIEKDTAYVGVLEVGQELVSLQIDGNRVRFEQGWVDIVSTRGKRVLTVLEEGVPRPPDPLQTADGTGSPTWQNPLGKDAESATDQANTDDQE